MGTMGVEHRGRRGVLRAVVAEPLNRVGRRERGLAEARPQRAIHERADVRLELTDPGLHMTRALSDQLLVVDVRERTKGGLVATANREQSMLAGAFMARYGR